MRYAGDQHVIVTKKFRLKTSTRLTKYFDSMCSESHIWLNAGCLAHKLGVSAFDCNKIITLVGTIPVALARGAIQASMEMKCSHLEYGKHTYPLFSSVPLGKKSSGSTVYFPRCKTPFGFQKGRLPPNMQSYKIVDVTNKSDKERQFELHVTVRKHIPPRKMTGIQAGIDLGGHHTMVATTSDGQRMVLTLRERDTMRAIAKLHAQMSRCKKYSCRYNRLRDKMASIYKKMGNRQMDKLRKFNNKLIKLCDVIIVDAGNLTKMRSRGAGKKGMNRTMAQAKPGAAREDLAKRAPAHNTYYREANPANTSKQCGLCASMDTWRKGRKTKCFACDIMKHADYNGSENMLFNNDNAAWSKRAQRVRELCDKAGLALRDQIDLGRRTIPPSVGDWVAGTRDPRKHRKNKSLDGRRGQQKRKRSTNFCMR